MINKTLYPVFLNLANLQVLVVGGGYIAERKIELLIDTGAIITIVSPDITSTISAFIPKHPITWIQDLYNSSYIDGKNLVISATNNTTVNETVFKDATNRLIFVNSVDDPQRCSFIVPASCRKGDIQIAVCTAGAAPGLSSKIRNALAEQISDRTVTLVSTIKGLRQKIKELPQANKKAFWDHIFSLNPDHSGTNEDLVEKIQEIFNSVKL